jgi:immunoglobulin-binding protein 1
VFSEIVSMADLGTREASFNAPTSKELLQEASELDGTLEGEEKSEQKRKEEEEWALYTEANPKGMGNTLNRG